MCIEMYCVYKKNLLLAFSNLKLKVTGTLYELLFKGLNLINGFHCQIELSTAWRLEVWFSVFQKGIWTGRNKMKLFQRQPALKELSPNRILYNIST